MTKRIYELCSSALAPHSKYYTWSERLSLVVDCRMFWAATQQGVCRWVGEHFLFSLFCRVHFSTAVGLSSSFSPSTPKWCVCPLSVSLFMRCSFHFKLFYLFRLCSVEPAVWTMWDSEKKQTHSFSLTHTQTTSHMLLGNFVAHFNICLLVLCKLR